jgi:HD-GYP domain-containing protein (c-di-GMP phosphodiesterase class II)
LRPTSKRRERSDPVQDNPYAMKYQAQPSGSLFADLAIHDSRESIKNALAAARELLGLRIEYRSDWDADPPMGGVDSRELRVPLRFSDGRLYGELHCTARNGQPVPERDAAFVQVLARIVAAQLEAEEQELDRLRLHAESMGVQALLAAIDARDHYTGDHSKSVVRLSARVARELDLSARQIVETEQVALLHDVGKVAVPDEILQKPGPLDDRERAVIETHPVIGARIVRSIAGLAHLAPAIRAGHERWDGAGYPDGLAGEEIPVVSRITFVCDAWDAMTTDRPYRRALGREHALREIESNAGAQFCARAAHALLAVVADVAGSAAKVSRTVELND